MIRGTSHDQDARFKDKAKKMLLESNWPDKYDNKIDLTKIDFQSLKQWTQKRTTEVLGYQDDIVSGTIISLLEQCLAKEQRPNAKKIHIAISGFLTNQTLTFMCQLWDWLDQAQKSKSGISKKLFDQKKQQQYQKSKRLKQLNEKKQKMKDYKFDVIKRHLGRRNQQSPDQFERKDRKLDRGKSNERQQKKSKRKRKSQSREKKKKKRNYQSEQQYHNSKKNKHQHKKKDKKRHRRSYSKSFSPQDGQRSRSRDKNQKQKYMSRNINQTPHKESRKTKGKRKQNQIDREERSQSRNQRRKSIQRSQSSQVISSSSQD